MSSDEVFLHVVYSPSDSANMSSLPPPVPHRIVVSPPGTDVVVAVTGVGDSTPQYLSSTVCPLVVSLLQAEGALPAKNMRAQNNSNAGREIVGRVRAFLDEAIDCEGVLTTTVVEDIMAASKLKNLV